MNQKFAALIHETSHCEEQRRSNLAAGNATQHFTDLGIFNSNDFVRERAVGLLGNYSPTRDMVEEINDPGFPRWMTV
jgi:hypothetical protein